MLQRSSRALECTAAGGLFVGVTAPRVAANTSLCDCSLRELKPLPQVSFSNCSPGTSFQHMMGIVKQWPRPGFAPQRILILRFRQLQVQVLSDRNVNSSVRQGLENSGTQVHVFNCLTSGLHAAAKHARKRSSATSMRLSASRHQLAYLSASSSSFGKGNEGDSKLLKAIRERMEAISTSGNAEREDADLKNLHSIASGLERMNALADAQTEALIHSLRTEVHVPAREGPNKDLLHQARGNGNVEESVGHGCLEDGSHMLASQSLQSNTEGSTARDRPISSGRRHSQSEVTKLVRMMSKHHQVVKRAGLMDEMLSAILRLIRHERESAPSVSVRQTTGSREAFHANVGLEARNENSSMCDQDSLDLRRTLLNEVKSRSLMSDLVEALGPAVSPKALVKQALVDGRPDIVLKLSKLSNVWQRDAETALSELMSDNTDQMYFGHSANRSASSSYLSWTEVCKRMLQMIAAGRQQVGADEIPLLSSAPIPQVVYCVNADQPVPEGMEEGRGKGVWVVDVEAFAEKATLVQICRPEGNVVWVCDIMKSEEGSGNSFQSGSKAAESTDGRHEGAGEAGGRLFDQGSGSQPEWLHNDQVSPGSILWAGQDLSDMAEDNLEDGEAVLNWLQDCFASPDCTIVTSHGLSNELRMLANRCCDRFDRRPSSVKCTDLALSYLFWTIFGSPRGANLVSLKHMVAFSTCTNMSKAEQNSRWDKRPLQASQLLYAASDASLTAAAYRWLVERHTLNRDKASVQK